MVLSFNKTDQELENEYQEAIKERRRSKRSIKTVLATGVFILIISIPLVIGYFAYQAYTAHIRLNNGIIITAILDNNYTEVKSDRTGTSYKVSYSFNVDEKAYSGTSSLPEMPASNVVTVIYDPADPSNNKIEGSEDFFERTEEVIILALVAGIITSLFSIGLKAVGKAPFSNTPKVKPSIPVNKPSPQSGKDVALKPSNTFQISSGNILKIEKDLLKLNQIIYGEDRPEYNPDFFQSLPKILLTKDILSANDIAEAANNLVQQTRQRVKNLDIPFRKPRVEFASRLPNDEPGHIEFGEYETVIRIHPEYQNNPFALASILCHELAHFVLDQNGIRKSNRLENERLTDLFVFKCGQGLIYLQGILDITSENGQTVENRLGYLSLEEMAYAHVRSSSQYGLIDSKIMPDYFSGTVFEEVKKAIEFLSLKRVSSKQLAEIILCPDNHILRISTGKKSQVIRCPKCRWEKEIWFRKNDRTDYLMNEANKNFDSGNFCLALETFRQVQEIDKRHSLAYCQASRCLKKMGRKQDAIRELQKLLSIYPEDQPAQQEMKSLIYD